MENEALHWQFDQIKVTAFVPEEVDGRLPLVYVPGEADGGSELWRLLSEPRPVMIYLEGFDWNRDLSPWPAPKAFRQGRAFAGEGPRLLSCLQNEIIPLVEGQLPVTVTERAIAGYSLAGLFALYASYQTDLFQRAASASGSLWFDGWMDYMLSHAPSAKLRRVCLSLGDREKKTSSPRMARVEDCTLEAAWIFREKEIQTSMTMNPGGHFQEILPRLAAEIDRLYHLK